MDSEFRRKLIDLFNASAQELVDIGRKAMRDFYHGLRAGGLDDEKATNAVIMFTRLFVSADRDCTRDEFLLFKAITGFDVNEDQFFEMTNYGSNSQFVSDICDFASVLTQEDRAAMIVFGCAIVSADGKITDSEFALIDKLMSLPYKD